MISNVVGDVWDAGSAQDAMPHDDTYALVAPSLALSWTPVSYTVGTAGEFCWPNPPLEDLKNPQASPKPDPSPEISHGDCSSP